MYIGTWMGAHINLHIDNLEIMTTFQYLRSTLAEIGDLDAEMTHRIQSGRKKLVEGIGVLCDRRISYRVKGKVYKTIVKPAMVYAAETLAVKKPQYTPMAEIDEGELPSWTQYGMKELAFIVTPKSFSFTVLLRIVPPIS